MAKKNTGALLGLGVLAAFGGLSLLARKGRAAGAKGGDLGVLPPVYYSPPSGFSPPNSAPHPTKDLGTLPPITVDVDSRFSSYVAKPGESVHIRQFAPTINDSVTAQSAVQALSLRGHTNVKSQPGSKTGTLFEYDTFALPNGATFQAGQTSTLGGHATQLLSAGPVRVS